MLINFVGQTNDTNHYTMPIYQATLILHVTSVEQHKSHIRQTPLSILIDSLLNWLKKTHRCTVENFKLTFIKKKVHKIASNFNHHLFSNVRCKAKSLNGTVVKQSCKTGRQHKQRAITERPSPKCLCNIQRHTLFQLHKHMTKRPQH